jgi:hypothetical protein
MKKVEGLKVHFVGGKSVYYEGSWANDLFRQFVADPERSDVRYQAKDAPRTVTIFTEDGPFTLNMDNVCIIEWKYKQMSEEERLQIFI